MTGIDIKNLIFNKLKNDKQSGKHSIPEEYYGILINLPFHLLGNFYKIDELYWKYLVAKYGISDVLKHLNSELSENVSHKINDVEFHIKWEAIGLFYWHYQNQIRHSIQIFQELYYKMTEYQISDKLRIHKGMPLIWLSDLYNSLNYRISAKKHAMLALCEDVWRDFISERINTLNIDNSGAHLRLFRQYGMSQFEIEEYEKSIINVIKKNKELSIFPEWIIQNIGNDWLIEYPFQNEITFFKPNLYYIKVLLDKSENDKKGKYFEYVAAYIMSNIPGFRTVIRKRHKTTDFDVFCTIEGDINVDFRAEMGRYIICECKDWDKPADFTTILKFSSILDSARCKAGILFSKKGITGSGNDKCAEREILKLSQRNGITVIVIDEKDIQDVINGYNFFKIMKNKYEKIRFDLKE